MGQTLIRKARIAAVMSRLMIPVGPMDHMQGNGNARLVLVEYGDYQCPACGSAYPVVKALQTQFAGHLCFVFRNFPLAQVHPQAFEAACVAEFAAMGGKFWPVHDALYENQDEFGLRLYESIAREQGLKCYELRDALDSGLLLQRIRGDFNGGVRSGVKGTPTFFINGVRYDGEVDVDVMADVLDRFAFSTSLA
jgi:protein-disulfide isomerase